MMHVHGCLSKNLQVEEGRITLGNGNVTLTPKQGTRVALANVG
jgi:hypothetical protein